MLARLRGMGRVEPSTAKDKPDGVARRRIRILAHDEHPDIRQRLPEGPQDVRRRRQDRMAAGNFAAEESQDFAQRPLDRRQRLGPVGGHQLIQRQAGHLGEADGLGRAGLQLEQGIGVKGI